MMPMISLTEGQKDEIAKLIRREISSLRSWSDQKLATKMIQEYLDILESLGCEEVDRWNRVK